MQVGPPVSVYERPNSRWVAGFVGDINMIEGRITEVYPSFVTFERGAMRWRLPHADVAPGEAALALRPEKIRIASAAPEGEAGNGASGVITGISYLGTHSLYQVRLDDGLTLEAAAMNELRDAARAFACERPRVAVMGAGCRRAADAMSKPAARHWTIRAAILAPYAWLAAFFLAPFLIVLKISLSQTAIALPPYEPVLDLAAGWQGVKDFLAGLSLDNYISLAADRLYLWSYWKSIEVAAVSTAILLLIGYPVAYALARAPRSAQGVLVLLVILPFWTSFLIRVYAWVNILQRDGLLNQALMALRLIDEPLTWLATDSAVYLGVVYSYFPFMVLPLYAALEKMDRSLLEAAADLGCPPWRAFFTITMPLVALRHRGGLAALLHPDHGRVRHSRPARLVVDLDDRAGAVDWNSSPTRTGRSPPRSRSCCSRSCCRRS